MSSWILVFDALYSCMLQNNVCPVCGKRFERLPIHLKRSGHYAYIVECVETVLQYIEGLSRCSRYYRCRICWFKTRGKAQFVKHVLTQHRDRVLKYAQAVGCLSVAPTASLCEHSTCTSATREQR